MGLGFIYVVVPTIGWSWPALLPLAILAAAKVGYDVAQDPERNGLPSLDRVKNRLRDTRFLSIPLSELLSERGTQLNFEPIAEGLASDQMLHFQRGDSTLVFRKDTRGVFHVDMIAPERRSKKELRAEAAAFAAELVQSFAVNKVVTELEKTNATVVEEERTGDGDVVLKLRRWV